MKNKLYSISSIAILIILTNNFQSSLCQELPQSGDLIITEFMSNPGSVSDTKGEWFEIMNLTQKTLIINGLLFKDDGPNQFTIEADSVIQLLPGELYLLARSGKSEENGGLFPDYVYSNFTLSNTEDEIIVCLSDGTILDEVKYNSEWNIQKGISLELDPSFMDSGFNTMSKWNLATRIYGDGDMGSPGSANSYSTNIENPVVLNDFFAYPNPCSKELNIDVSLSNKVPIDISLINLAGQEISVFKSNYCDRLCLQLETEFFEKGVWIIMFRYEQQIRINKILIF